MKKTYFIYWHANEEYCGNQVISFDPKKLVLMDLINLIIKNINSKGDIPEVESIVIKFMMELK